MNNNTKLIFDFFNDLNNLFYYQDNYNKQCYKIYLEVEHILKTNAIDFTQQDEKGNTLLHYAFLCKNFRYIHILLQKGVNPFVINNQNDNCFQMSKDQSFISKFWKEYEYSFNIEEKNVHQIIHTMNQFHADFKQIFFEKNIYSIVLDFVPFLDFLEKTNLKSNYNILLYYSKKIQIDNINFQKLILYASQNKFSEVENSFLLFNFKNVEQNRINQKIILSYLEKNQFAIDENFIKFLYYFGTYPKEMYSKNIQLELTQKIIQKNYNIENNFNFFLQQRSGQMTIYNMKHLLENVQLFPLYEKELLNQQLSNKQSIHKNLKI